MWISNLAFYATFKFVDMSFKKFELNNYEQEIYIASNNEYKGI